MTLTVSEQLQQRKQHKFERELTRVLSRAKAKDLDAFISHLFQFHDDKPSADHFVGMTLASKFGIGNSLAEGGVEFMFETCLKAFNEVKPGGRLENAEIQPWGSMHTGNYSTTDLWNAAFIYEVDSKLYPHITEFEPSDFVWANDISPYLFLDKATQAFGFVIVPQPAMTLDQFKAYGSPFLGWEKRVQAWFDRTGFARLRIVDFDSGPMEYISVMNIVFGPVDKLVGCLPDRVRHNVISHDRRLQSGTVTTVRAHKRKTPLRLVSNKRVLTDHIVYSVKDSYGQTRYYGEGKRDRWKHVNSGASHNIKINEHFFTKGQMLVELLGEGLTKSEALSIERMLIRKDSHLALWNVKDFEPFVSESDAQVSRQEIEDFGD
jgi:hypothetical protein